MKDNIRDAKRDLDWCKKNLDTVIALFEYDDEKMLKLNQGRAESCIITIIDTLSTLEKNMVTGKIYELSEKEKFLQDAINCCGFNV